MIPNKVGDILSSDECESFSIAFAFHAICLLILSLVFTPIKNSNPSFIIESSVIENEPQIEPIPVEIINPILSNNSETAFTEVDIPIESEDTSLKIENIDTPISLDIEENETLYQINTEILSHQISGVSDKLGKGLSSQSSTGGALDRLTAEIINHAEYRNVHVLWLFDASLSLSNQRSYISHRFDKILKEIDFSKNNRYAITHSIYSFGSSYFKLCDPTNDSGKLKVALESISLDLSGTENIFQTVNTLSIEHGKNDPRLMFVIFTDEAGDDIEWLDRAAFSCRRKGISVYVVGSPAPFGKSKTQFKYVDPDPAYDQKEKWVEIIQGPETLYSMLLDLHSLSIDNETLDSGYGPFGLCSLCSTTGGIYFSVHPNRTDTKLTRKDIAPLSSNISKFFDFEIMKNYPPDYRSPSQQIKEINTHNIKAALLKAASIRLDISNDQILTFSAFTEGDFVENLNNAQKFSARIEPKINEIYQILQKTEKDIPTLKDKRWIASYYLAMGRILSTKCRIEFYNLILAEAKSGLKKKNPNTNNWILVPTNNIVSNNSQINKNYQQALYYLKYVVDNYPDTPWAYIANEEIKTPFGYEWKESHIEPPKMGGGGGNNNPPKDDMIKKLQPKPQRKIDKI